MNRYSHHADTVATVASTLYNGERGHVFVTERADGEPLSPSQVANAIRAHRAAIVRAGVRPVDPASQYSAARPVYARDRWAAYDRTRIVRIETGIYPPTAGDGAPERMARHAVKGDAHAAAAVLADVDDFDRTDTVRAALGFVSSVPMPRGVAGAGASTMRTYARGVLNGIGAMLRILE